MKSIWKSKTFWLNILAITVMILEVLVNFEPIPVEWQAVIAAVLNILIRLKTNQPIQVPEAIYEVVDAVKRLRKK